MMPISSVICVLAVILSANYATALQCYACNSKDNKLCDWSFTSFTYPTEECQSAGVVDSLIHQKCYKITAEGKDGSSYIARGCTPPATLSVACSGLAQTIGWISSNTDQEGLRNLNCETCETDKCNTGANVKVTAVTVATMLVSAALFLF